jgi:plasmid stability protein
MFLVCVILRISTNYVARQQVSEIGQPERRQVGARQVHRQRSSGRGNPKRTVTDCASGAGADRYGDITMSTHQLPVRLPEDVYIALKAHATYSERSMNDITVEALRALLGDETRRAEIDAAADRVRKKYRRALDRLAE